jgi:hypothetical protein
MTFALITPELLGGLRAGDERDRAAANRRILAKLLGSFATFVRTELSYDLEEAFFDDPSIGTAAFAPRQLYGGPLAIEWHGILSYNASHGEFRAGVSLFLFSRSQRLRAPDSHCDYLVARYAHDVGDGASPWSDLMWVKDDYGEWEDVTPLSRPPT